VRSTEGGSKIFPGTATGVNEAAFAEVLPGGPVCVRTPALLIGSEGASNIRTLVPVDSEPAEIFESSSGVFRPTALGVEVLDAHD
jgi:hypothetical protein